MFTGTTSTFLAILAWQQLKNHAEINIMLILPDHDLIDTLAESWESNTESDIWLIQKNLPQTSQHQ